MKAVIVDLDGTFFDCRHRLHHVNGGKRDWPAFFGAIGDDTVVEPIAELVRTLAAAGNAIVYASGRPEEYREISERMIHDANAPLDRLYMRPTGDTRPDHVVKAQILRGIREDGYEPWLVVDDRESVVQMWREHDLVCLQAAPHQEPIPKTARLTLMVGPSGAGKSSYVLLHEEHSHVISSDRIRTDLCGDFRDQSRNADVFEAVHAIAKTRLKHGLPVVIDATHLRRKDRLASALLVPDYCDVTYVVVNRTMAEKYRDGGWRNEVLSGGEPFDLIAAHEQTFNSQLKDILRGDGLPNVKVVDVRNPLSLTKTVVQRAA